MPPNLLTQRNPLFFYGSSSLILATATIRGLAELFSTHNPFRWVAVTLLLVFFVGLVSQPWLTRHFPLYPRLYLLVQTGLILSLLLIPPYLDFFSILFVPLSIQVMWLFPHRVGLGWIGAFTLIVAGALFYSYGWFKGLPFVLLYGSAYFFIGSYTATTLKAEAARRESQALLIELQTAHRQLQNYAAQAEELAVTQERNRLARELHDSVTQTIFSMTLTAKAARILLERDPAQVAAQLDHLQELAQGALAEMRTLIFQLRPTSVEEEGLVPALRKHLTTLQSLDGLVVELQVEGEQRLPQEQEIGLFRIVQEALNNVVKHAHTDRAVVRLNFEPGQVRLVINDEGQGFDLKTFEPTQPTMGLVSMRERTVMLGGQFTLESCPGKGTQIRVQIPQDVTGNQAGGAKQDG